MNAKKYLEEKNGKLTFAKILRAWRLGEELTQGALAKRIGLSTAAISRFENGVDFPTVETVNALAQVFGIDASAFAVYIVRDMAEKKGFVDIEVFIKSGKPGRSEKVG